MQCVAGRNSKGQVARSLYARLLSEEFAGQSAEQIMEKLDVTKKNISRSVKHNSVGNYLYVRRTPYFDRLYENFLKTKKILPARKLMDE